jgi:hypothetical protein
MGLGRGLREVLEGRRIRGWRGGVGGLCRFSAPGHFGKSAARRVLDEFFDVHGSSLFEGLTTRWHCTVFVWFCQELFCVGGGGRDMVVGRMRQRAIGTKS